MEYKFGEITYTTEDPAGEEWKAYWKVRKYIAIHDVVNYLMHTEKRGEFDNVPTQGQIEQLADEWLDYEKWEGWDDHTYHLFTDYIDSTMKDVGIV